MPVSHHYTIYVCGSQLIVESIQYTCWAYASLVIIFCIILGLFYCNCPLEVSILWVLAWCHFGSWTSGICLGLVFLQGWCQAFDCSIGLFAVWLLAAVVVWASREARDAIGVWSHKACNVTGWAAHTSAHQHLSLYHVTNRTRHQLVWTQPRWGTLCKLKSWLYFHNIIF